MTRVDSCGIDAEMFVITSGYQLLVLFHFSLIFSHFDDAQ